MIKNQFAQFIIIFLGLTFSPYSIASEYGPVAAKETLWNIASRHRPNEAITTQQVMLAIRRANPDAFQANNINALKAGVMLRLPGVNEIRLMDTAQALKAAQSENSDWQSKQKTSTSNIAVSSYKQHYQASQRELTKLQKQLRREKNKVKALKADIHSLQSSSNKEVTLTPLTQKIASLKQLIEEKNVHIAQLENMKIVASETIKQQLANNEILFNKLKNIDPKHVMDLGASATSGSLELKSLGENNTAATTAPNFTPTEVDTHANLVSANTSNVSTWLILTALILISLFIFYVLWNMYIQYRLERRMRSDIAPSEETPNIEPAASDLSSDRKEPQLGT